MAASKEILVASFFEGVSLGDVYETTLPQHATLLHWFEGDPEGVASVTRGACRIWDPVEVHIGDIALFGRLGDIPVYRLEPKATVVALHKTLLRGVNCLPGTHHPELQWTGDGYNPHVTIHAGHPALGKGKELLMDNLVVAVRSEESSPREIIHTERLRNA